MIYVFDVIKFIMSFLVVAIHVNPLIDFTETGNFYLVNSFGRIAVPIFFAIAGYLLYTKLSKNKENYREIVIKYLSRIIKIYIIWSLIYFIPYLSKNPSIGRVIKFIPHLLLDCVYSQLWYLQSLIVGVFLSTFLTKKIGIKKTFIISFILYIIGLILVPYLPLFKNIFMNIPILSKIIISLGKKIGRNGFLFGMLFITLGGYISQQENKKEINNKVCIIGLITSTILLLVETTMIKIIEGQYWGLQLSLIPITYFLIVFLLNINSTTKKNYDTKNIRILSLLIYLIHEWIHFLYNLMINKLKISTLLNNSMVEYIVIIIITIIISELIIKLSNNNNFKFLKNLY